MNGMSQQASANDRGQQALTFASHKRRELIKLRVKGLDKSNSEVYWTERTEIAIQVNKMSFAEIAKALK